MTLNQLVFLGRVRRHHDDDAQPMAIAKIKALLRRLARRTFADLVDAIGQAMASVSNEDALHFIRHCGYVVTVV